MGAGSVTVVIPTHDRRAFLEAALTSALQQGPVLAKVVVVNDGSTDGTRGWLDGLDDGRVAVRHRYPGGGGGAARRAGFELCDTPYVMFLDDDDVLRPGALTRLVSALERRPAAAGAAGAGHRFGAPTDRARTIHPRWPMTRPVWKEVLFCWGLYPAALLWRSSVVTEIGGWSDRLRRFEDRDLVLRAYPRPFVLVPQVVADLRVHPGQVTNVAHEELDWRLRAEFVDGLRPEDRPTGRAILASARTFEAGLDAYRRGDYRPLRTVLDRALAADTTLAGSPILAPWLFGLAVKCRLLGALPASVSGAARRAVRSGRDLIHQKTTR